MEYKYFLRVDTLTDERGKSFSVYGITAFNCSSKQVEVSIPVIFFSKNDAEDFVFDCNSFKLDVIHLWDVVRDQLFNSLLNRQRQLPVADATLI